MNAVVFLHFSSEQSSVDEAFSRLNLMRPCQVTLVYEFGDHLPIRYGIVLAEYSPAEFLMSEVH